MKIVWNEENIRNELRKLDEKTGFHGADLPIVFSKSKRELGKFTSVNRKPQKFTFSKHFFDDPEFPVSEAIQTIRHEYAHYMNMLLHRNGGHGKDWEACCARIDACPIWAVTKEFIELQRKQEVLCDALNSYESGSEVIHPRFGKGRIESAYGEGERRIAVVAFSDQVMKISVKWINEHCVRIDPNSNAAN